MVDPQKLGSALYAFNTVLILAREMAYDGRPGKEIADILDTAEFLPRLLAEAEDHTSMFREYLVLLSNKNPTFSLAVERFDKPTPPKW